VSKNLATIGQPGVSGKGGAKVRLLVEGNLDDNSLDARRGRGVMSKVGGGSGCRVVLSMGTQ